jgi:histidyl-tRNA synthetase
MTITPRTMPGVMELLPLDQIAFQGVLDRIRRGYELFGFVPIETPVLEFKDVLLTKSGGDTEKQVFVVSSTGAIKEGHEARFAMRFDLTVPLARYVAEHENDLQFPFRRYQIQRVYRGESAQRGRFREFYQCDIDIVGKDELPISADAEIPAVIHHVFDSLQVGGFTIHISNRKILKGLMRHLGIVDERASLVLREIDKIDKRGREAVERTLHEGDFGLDEPGIALLMDVIALRGGQAEVVPALRAMQVDDEIYRRGVDELDSVLRSLQQIGVPADCYTANMAIARGLDYYTGTVYETLLDGHEAIGSVCSGGRYDDLATHYTRSKLPGVGISIGATRLFYQLREAGLLQAASRSSTQVFLAQMEPELDADYRRMAALLREYGIATELHFMGWKLKKQLKYVSRVGIPVVVLYGSDERERGMVQLRDMTRGMQREVPLAEMRTAVAEMLALPPGEIARD